MTPFGEKLQKLRKDRNVTQKEMAAALGVSAAYLSALEHGHRGKPRWSMLQRIITYFNIIWDEAEELQYLATISDPNVKVDTINLTPDATKLANQLARNIYRLDATQISSMLEIVSKTD